MECRYYTPQQLEEATTDDEGESGCPILPICPDTKDEYERHVKFFCESMSNVASDRRTMTSEPQTVLEVLVRDSLVRPDPPAVSPPTLPVAFQRHLEQKHDTSNRYQPYQIPSRDCTHCGKKFPWYGQENVTLCTDCFKLQARKCEKCHLASLPVGAPAWRKVCGGCYKDYKQSKGYLPCPRCPPERATHLRRAPNEPCCRMCAQALIDSQAGQQQQL
jgi:hypothetical protein